MKEENKKLRETLNQVKSNYDALQMHLFSLTQRQPQPKSNNESIHKAVEDGGGVVAPRQFMDLGPSGNAQCEPSQSSTASPDRIPNSPALINNEIAPLDDDDYSSKAPKPSTSNGAEPAQQVIMRKARVSVRARSETPMVANQLINQPKDS